MDVKDSLIQFAPNYDTDRGFADVEVLEDKPKTNFDRLLEYQSSIQPQIDAAKNVAVAGAENEQQKNALEHGHGKYVGSCGHTIRQCRCTMAHGTINVDAPCEQCWRDNQENK